MKKPITSEINHWMQFLAASPVAVHATEQVAQRLQERGFVRFHEEQPWKIEGKTLERAQGQGFFVMKEGSLIAFHLPRELNQEEASFRLWGAHTDSPGLKLKPISEVNKKGYQMISTEVYGGAILSPWFDRPLGLAGQVFIQSKNQGEGLEERLLFLNEPLMVIPHAAIHLHRDVNKQFTINRETHLQALFSHHQQSLKDFLAERLDCQPHEILTHELFLVDIEPPKIFGSQGEFLNSPRLDNLAMVDAGLQGFLKAVERTSPSSGNPSQSSLASLPFEDLNTIKGILFFNHEEIGSQSQQGALSSFLSRTLERLGRSLFKEEGFYRCLAKSLMISADMSHGFHPNFESFYEGNHRPILNQGVVIKYNANQRYATSAKTSAIIKKLCSRHGIACQDYIHHGEIPCGSTIGPLVSSQLSIPTVDLGSPMLAMHSIRETAGIEDHLQVIRLAENFFTQKL